jgi:uncharacterized membrane protein YjgN (DUF898 family)
MSAVAFSEPWPTSIPEAAPVKSASETPVDRVAFVGNRRAYWGLIVRGTVLQAMTLGLYRFWLFTDMRRFIWASISIDGESLEYTGTPRELLIGFLVAIGILVPINGLIFMTTLELGGFSRFSGLIGVIALAIFGQYAAYRTRRFRLTRTLLRGVGFHQTGSGWIYAFKSCAWTILNWLTLGLTYPWSAASLERYKMRHTFYGNIRGQFVGKGSRLFAAGISIWLAIVTPLVGGFVIAAELLDWAAVGRALEGNGAVMFTALLAIKNIVPATYLAIGGVVLAGLLAIILYPAFQAIVMRWWLAGLRLGDATTTSDLRIRKYYGAYVRYILYLLAFAAIMSVLAGIGIAAGHAIGIDLAKLFAPKNTFTTIAAAGWSVVAMLVTSAIFQVVIKFRMWQVAAESIVVTNLASLGDAQASDASASAVGEGLADAIFGAAAI